jgi:hypothetical protein
MGEITNAGGAFTCSACHSVCRFTAKISYEDGQLRMGTIRSIIEDHMPDCSIVGAAQLEPENVRLN